MSALDRFIADDSTFRRTFISVVSSLGAALLSAVIFGIVSGAPGWAAAALGIVLYHLLRISDRVQGKA